MTDDMQREIEEIGVLIEVVMLLAGRAMARTEALAARFDMAGVEPDGDRSATDGNGDNQGPDGPRRPS